MRTNVRQIWEYSRCPQRYLFEKDDAEEGALSTFIDCRPIYLKVLQAAYHYRILNGEDIPWAKIRRLVGREEEVALYEDTLTRILRWWESTYRKDPRSGIARFRMTAQVGDVVVADEAPLVALAEGDQRSSLIVPTFGLEKPRVYYNSFILRTYLWLASIYTDSIIDVVELVDFDRAKPRVMRIRVHKGHHSMDVHVRAILKGMSGGVIYPSRTEMCKSCKHFDNCML